MQSSANLIADKLRKIMLDPSLLLDPAERPYMELEGDIYLPKSILGLSTREVSELWKFFGLYLSEREIQFGYSTFEERLSTRIWKKFDQREFNAQVPENLRRGYLALYEAEIPDPVKSILIDEFVFLTTHSCLLSRLKKPFKLFEKYDVFPLINLEERVPEDWVPIIKGMKKYAKWIAFPVSLTGLNLGLNLGLSTLIPIASVVEGVRLLIIDP